MVPLRKRAVSIVAAMAAVAGISAVAAPAASASGGYGSCGSGYHLIDTYPLRLEKGANTGGAKILLYYNSSNGYNCAITQTTGASFGRSHQKIGVELTSSEGFFASRRSRSDEGQYRYYAGPVSVLGRDRCIDVSGWLSYYTPYGTLVSEYYRAENQVHCG
ncbi:Uncharacterised protein [Mycobacterium tuberculosis]|nr:Uncharacterised protein [Mycobacterium tuberculosis]